MAAEVETIRHFNRTVTRAIGIFGTRYLGRPRPLAASRLLFEIGARGVEVRTLRERLGLDSGYLSRLLRALERDALIRVERSEQDRRVRRVLLTDQGRAEVRILDRLSDEAAGVLLDSLPSSKKPQLLAAMQVVDRLLMSRAIEIVEVSVRDVRAQTALRSYFAELAARFESGFDPGEDREGEVFAPPSGLFVLATLYGDTIGCGALHYFEEYAEVKRMWVDPTFRGIGTGSRILESLESSARQAGHRTIRLDTNDCLHEAQSLYSRAGYRHIPRYNDNPYAQRWYEKRFPREDRG